MSTLTDSTFVCPTEIIAFSDRINEFKSLNAEVVAVSVDSHFSHLAWVKTPRKVGKDHILCNNLIVESIVEQIGGIEGIKIPILSDLNKQVSKDYGVLLEDAGLALRGLFIIDPKSIVRQITINDLPIGRSVDETLR